MSTNQDFVATCSKMSDDQLLHMNADSALFMEDAKRALANEIEKRQPSISEVSSIKNEHPNLNGVGGWLLWFCISATIFTPALLVVSVLAHPSGYSLIDICLAAFSVFTGVSLWRVRPRALLYTKILLILQFCIAALIFIAALIDSIPGSSTSDAPKTLAGKSIFYVFIWALYFTKSKRVRAVYGRSI